MKAKQVNLVSDCLKAPLYPGYVKAAEIYHSFITRLASIEQDVQQILIFMLMLALLMFVMENGIFDMLNWRADNLSTPTVRRMQVLYYLKFVMSLVLANNSC